MPRAKLLDSESSSSASVAMPSLDERINIKQARRIVIIAQALSSVMNTPSSSSSAPLLSVSISLPPVAVNEASRLLDTAAEPRPRGGREIIALFKDSIPGSCLPSPSSPSLAASFERGASS